MDFKTRIEKIYEKDVIIGTIASDKNKISFDNIEMSLDNLDTNYKNLNLSDNIIKYKNKNKKFYNPNRLLEYKIQKIDKDVHSIGQQIA